MEQDPVPDPDPYQNLTDPKHWLKGSFVFNKNLIYVNSLVLNYFVNKLVTNLLEFLLRKIFEKIPVSGTGH